MVHSIELLFDPDTEATLQRMWDDLAALGGEGDSVRIPPGRPHVTVAVARHIDADVDELLSPVVQRLPLRCVIGAPVLFGRGRKPGRKSGEVVLTRLIVPSRELLDLHAEVHRLCGPHLVPEPMPNSLPGQWTAHVTLARRVGGDHLGQSLAATDRPAQFDGHFAGMRRWDGDQRVEHPLS